MTTSKPRPLCSLKFQTQGRSYETNLATLLDLIAQTPERAIVLAPEVCLSNFDYEAFDAVSGFASRADKALREHSRGKTVVLTMIVRREEGYFNAARVYHDGMLVHEQHKAKLFALGEEDRWFRPGNEEEIVVFEIEGVRMGILVCFELRFTSLWERLRGAELIFVPAQWGRLRGTHYDILGKALAVANECYVMQSDADNDDTSGLSGIVTPSGECRRNGELRMLRHDFDRSEVKKMRRYLDTGIR